MLLFWIIASERVQSYLLHLLALFFPRGYHSVLGRNLGLHDHVWML